MKRRCLSHALSDFEEVPYLDGRCYEKSVHVATDNRVHCVLKWSYIFREGPLIDVHQRQDGTSLFQASRQFWIGDSIFLNGNATPIDRKCVLVLVQKNQQIAPRVGLGNGQADS